MQVQKVIEKPYNDHLPLIEASRYTDALCFSCVRCYSHQWESMFTTWFATLWYNADCATWTLFHKFSKLSVLPSMTAGCSWKHVRKRRTCERLLLYFTLIEWKWPKVELHFHLFFGNEIVLYFCFWHACPVNMQKLLTRSKPLSSNGVNKVPLSMVTICLYGSS